MNITYKTADDIERMREAGRLASEVLDYITPFIQPGITTLEIDRLSAECMARQGTKSATVGYQPPGYPPYPGHVCTSVNHVVCHANACAIGVHISGLPICAKVEPSTYCTIE